MSIDNIPLPAFLFRSVFANKLVDVSADITNKAVQEAPEIIFLGGNEKKIIFLFNDSQNRFLADTHVKFLFDLLAACGLTISDIALVNLFHNKTITYRELTVQLHARQILLFGISADELGLPFTIPFFQIQNFQEQVYTLSPSIEELQLKTELRKRLWECLQKIFTIPKQK